MVILNLDFLEYYKNAGKIASRVRENARRKDHRGKTLFEICESIEREIRENGGIPAFPVNTSLNEIAAHYTAEPDDQRVVNDGDVLKIDLGVHQQGFIADTAVTVSYDPNYESLVQTAENALSDALRIAKVDTKSSEIGKTIENTIKRSGFIPIQNLSGHSLEQYTIHAGKSIPNIWTVGSFQLLANQAYAIEPFVTLKNGAGIVREGNIANIFAIISRKPTKEKELDDFLNFLWARFKSLPFALRWTIDRYDEKYSREIIEILKKKKNIHSYPILVEGNDKIVAQAEHTIIPESKLTNVITM